MGRKIEMIKKVKDKEEIIAIDLSEFENIARKALMLIPNNPETKAQDYINALDSYLDESHELYKIYKEIKSRL